MTLQPVFRTEVKAIQKIYQSYCSSFPLDERRNENQFQALFSNSNVKVLLSRENADLLGYVILWKLSDCYYLEHFEVFNAFRNKGYGSEILGVLKNVYLKIILESEPEDLSEIAQRRIQFYKRNGFQIADSNYIQPAYEAGKKSLNLFLMSNFKIENKKQCIAELYRVAYGQ